MKRFAVIKNTFDISPVLDILKSLVGNRLDVKTEENFYILNYEYENQEDIQNIFISYGNENMVNILGYTSNADVVKLNRELEIALVLLNDLPFGMYTLKSALLQSKKIENKKQILEYIVSSSGVDEHFIKEFITNDLNISKASKAMYIHRNTLNYKLDKLKEHSGFDLRVFVDAYILYSLIL